MKNEQQNVTSSDGLLNAENINAQHEEIKIKLEKEFLYLTYLKNKLTEVSNRINNYTDKLEVLS